MATAFFGWPCLLAECLPVSSTALSRPVFRRKTWPPRAVAMPPNLVYVSLRQLVPHITESSSG